MPTLSDLRPSPIAGLWYDDDPARLARKVDGFLDQAVLPPLPGDALAVISPHAGHRYSGRAAGYAFAALRGRSPDLVAVLSPFHHYHPAAFLTTAHRAYATPLGALPVDAQAVTRLDAALKERGAYALTPIANDEEHALEIELPFLQRALAGPFQLLPVMVRTLEPHLAEALGQALAEALRGQNALLVASTDLSHFYPLAVAEQLDAEMLRAVVLFDPPALFEVEREGRGFACGLAAVAAVLTAARALGADTVRVLHHSTSAEETGDPSSVVGYGAAVVLKTV